MEDFNDNPFARDTQVSIFTNNTVCKILRKSTFLIFYFLFLRTTAF